MRIHVAYCIYVHRLSQKRFIQGAEEGRGVTNMAAAACHSHQHQSQGSLARPWNPNFNFSDRER